MASYKAPSFQERTSLAQQAREKALKLLQDKPVVDEATVAQRHAAQLAREAAEAAKREERRAAIEQQKADKLEKKLATEKAKPPVKVEQTDEEKKAARDARYAARKKRAK